MDIKFKLICVIFAFGLSIITHLLSDFPLKTSLNILGFILCILIYNLPSQPIAVMLDDHLINKEDPKWIENYTKEPEGIIVNCGNMYGLFTLKDV